MNNSTGQARPGPELAPGRHRPVVDFLAGVLAAMAGSWIAQQLLEGPRKGQSVNTAVAAADENHNEPSEGASSGQTDPEDPTATPGKVDNTSPWAHFWIGVTLSVPVIAIAIWLFVAYPAGPDNTWLLVRYSAFMLAPGLSLAVLGLYIRRQKKNQLVMYALSRHDYLTMALQFLPGTLISILGNLLPSEPMLFGWITISWASIVLGTCVSIMVVRKFGKP